MYQLGNLCFGIRGTVEDNTPAGSLGIHGSHSIIPERVAAYRQAGSFVTILPSKLPLLAAAHSILCRCSSTQSAAHLRRVTLTIRKSGPVRPVPGRIETLVVPVRIRPTAYFILPGL